MTPSSKLPHRRLGNDGPQVSAVGLGCMSLSGVYGANDDTATPDFIRYAIDRGIDFLDSADLYGWGHNEELLGRALKGLRDRVVIATKFGQVKTATGQGVDGRPAYVQQACEASLKRLNIETIDLYYQHRIDPNVPIEDTVGAMARLVEQGKVRHLGLCEARPETIRRAHKVHRLAAVQTEYSLLYRSEAEETLQTTRALGIAFVAYSPLGRGDHPRFAGDNFARNRDLVSGIVTIAREKNCTPAQLVLAWLLAQGQDIVPIPGTKQRSRLDENIGALDVVLSPHELARISAAIPAGAAAGERYPAGAMKAVYL